MARSVTARRIGEAIRRKFTGPDWYDIDSDYDVEIKAGIDRAIISATRKLRQANADLQIRCARYRNFIERVRDIHDPSFYIFQYDAARLLESPDAEADQQWLEAKCRCLFGKKGNNVSK